MRIIKSEHDGRAWYEEDFLNIQNNVLKPFEAYVSSFGDVVLEGVKKNGTSLTAGWVVINGQLADFSGKTNITYPCYLIIKETSTDPREYDVDGTPITDDTIIERVVEVTTSQPTQHHIELDGSGNEKRILLTEFLNKKIGGAINGNLTVNGEFSIGSWLTMKHENGRLKITSTGLEFDFNEPIYIKGQKVVTSSDISSLNASIGKTYATLSELKKANDKADLGIKNAAAENKKYVDDNFLTKKGDGDIGTESKPYENSYIKNVRQLNTSTFAKVYSFLDGQGWYDIVDFTPAKDSRFEANITLIGTGSSFGPNSQTFRVSQNWSQDKPSIQLISSGSFDAEWKLRWLKVAEKDYILQIYNQHTATPTNGLLVKFEIYNASIGYKISEVDLNKSSKKGTAFCEADTRQLVQSFELGNDLLYSINRSGEANFKNLQK